MSRSAFYLCIFMLIPAVVILIHPFNVTDLSIWVAIGRDSISKLSVIRHDSYTLWADAQREMIYPAGICWLYGAVYLVGGLALVSSLHALIPAVWIFTWQSNLARKPFLGGSSPNDFAVAKVHWGRWTPQDVWISAFALAGSSLVWIPRPALVATLPLLAAYVILSRKAGHRFSVRDLCSLSFLSCCWTNLHGTFLLLPMMLIWEGSGYALNREWILFRSRIVVGSAVMAASLLNPFAWHVVTQAFETAGVSKSRNFLEWLPPHKFYYPFTSVMFFALALLAFGRGLQAKKLEEALADFL